MKRLLLFDIDGTLLTTNGRGRDAFKKSIQDVFGRTFDPDLISFAGKTDQQILTEILDQMGLLSDHDPDLFRRALKLYSNTMLSLLDASWVEMLPGIEQLWERHDVLMFDSTRIRALDAEASLLQAAIHLQKDRFSRLHGFADVARIAREPNLDWEWIQGFAEEIGLSTHLNESLRVVSETLGIDLPVAAGKRSRLWRVIWGERTRLAGSVGMTRRVRTHYWIPFTIRGRRWEALKWWLRLVFPPRVLIDYLHPDSRGPYLGRILQYRLRLARERHRRNRDQRRQGEI